MAKLIGNKKLKTAVFISGKGSNLKSLIKFSKKKKSPIFINLIISDKKKAKGLRYAKQEDINFFTINYSNKNLAEKKIENLIKLNHISLICLAGFMRILSKKFIKSFKGKILNIHPSLLPKYKGLNTHKRVIENGEKYSGCTVHLVSSKVDSGKIILQKKIKVFKKDNEKKLSSKILHLEHKIYPGAIIKLFSNY